MHLEIRRDGPKQIVVDLHGISREDAVALVRDVRSSESRIVFQVPFEEMLAASTPQPTAAVATRAAPVTMVNGASGTHRGVAVQVAGTVVDEFTQQDIEAWTSEVGPRGVHVEQIREAVGRENDCLYKRQDVMVELYKSTVPYHVPGVKGTDGKPVLNPVYQWFTIRLEKIERDIVRHNPGFKFASHPNKHGYRCLQPK